MPDKHSEVLRGKRLLYNASLPESACKCSMGDVGVSEAFTDLPHYITVPSFPLHDKTSTNLVPSEEDVADDYWWMKLKPLSVS